jgi:chondroitin AC lyase
MEGMIASSWHAAARHRTSLLALLLAVLPSFVAAQTLRDLDQVRARWERWTIAPVNAATTVTQARRLISSQGEDGCWTKINYDDQQRSIWLAAKHLDNLSALATASYLQRQHGSADAAMDRASLLALRCWLRRDPKNPNWWWNQIGAPRLLARSALLLDPLLSAADRKSIDVILRRADWSHWTGQNLAWGVDIQMERGLLALDVAAVRQAFERLYQEISIAPMKEANGQPGEGIQSDSSFHQHGAQLYSGGYGFDFGEDAGREIALGWGTAFTVPRATMEIFSSFLLDGQQWMIRAGLFDDAARGREITRAEHASTPRMNAEFVRVVEALAELDTPRQKELRHFAATLKQPRVADEVTGNRFFWNSDLMEHKRAGYALSIRMLSARTRNEETVNGEGLRSAHLADGATLLYKNGEEYRLVFPAWNWNLIPGTTALQWRSPAGLPLTGEAQPIGQYGSNDFAGGVSNGQIGAAAMDLKRGPLSARKAWFLFDHFFVALGAEITLAHNPATPAATVATSIEQCNRQGAVDEQRLADGRRVIAHNDVGYLLEAGTKSVLTSGMQSGRWSEIGTGPSDLVERPVFNLWIDHGTQPVHASYQYEVFPEGGLAAAQQEAASPTVRVLANREDLQAVVAAKDLMAVFYRAGSLASVWGKISVNAPSLILVEDDGAEVRITAANPRATALHLIVTLGRRAISFDLPGGTLGGKSQTKSMAR